MNKIVDRNTEVATAADVFNAAPISRELQAGAEEMWADLDKAD